MLKPLNNFKGFCIIEVMKKKFGIILGSSIGVIALTASLLVAFLPVTYNFDKSLIKQNPEYSVTKSESNGYTTLTNGKDTFKIIGFTDMHLDTYARKGRISLEMMIRNITNEKPDLVIFDGDIITSSFNQRRAKQFSGVMDKLGVYWAAVLGNHEGDNKYSISRDKIFDIYSKSKYFLGEKSQTLKDGTFVDGCGNYVINIANSNNEIYQSLYFLDGHQVMSKEDLEKYKSEIIDINYNDYDYIKESQINWYKETVEDINTFSGSIVKSMMFVHIPLCEYKTAYESITGEISVTNETPEYNVPNSDGDMILYGKRREAICHPGHNSGMFDVIKELGSTKAVISGHDHINDFILSYQGVKLGYCESSGYSSYNVLKRKLEKQLLKGYSIFEISSEDVKWTNIKNADKWPELQDKILRVCK